ncbi:MAG: pantetheine-phosphate adenylyltransferase [Thaumarchaeota archaeon]|nr:pantetheine-phosphate adenylyltransferase [Nitrososphaerota archaeon]
MKVAVGGTFEGLHAGHVKLLKKALELGDEIIIGVTSDQFVEKMGKKIETPYLDRILRVKEKIDEIAQKSFRFYIAMLDDPYGPVLKEDVDFIVVSPESFKNALKANILRKKIGFKPMNIYVINFVKAETGSKISSSDIRKGKILPNGKSVKLKVKT